MAVQSKAIKARIKSVRNTKKITKAMELVSASKMRRVVSKTVGTRPYIEHSLDIIHAIKSPQVTHPLLLTQKADKSLIVVITSNKGLCGGYNAQILRTVASFLGATDEQYDFVTVGKKGDVTLRQNGSTIIAAFEQKLLFTIRDSAAIGDFVIKQFLTSTYARVYVAYTEYLSALNQQPQIKQILPFIDETSTTSSDLVSDEYLFEPEADAILDVVVDKIIHTRLYGMLLESAASEESARMVAMKSASDAAGEMITDLSLRYNKIRQASITQEISEISAGMTSSH